MKLATILSAALTVVCLGAPALAAPGGFLGVYLTEDGEREGGALIEDVAPDSPAAQAGLCKGDRVVRVNGKAIRNSADLIPTLVAADPGQTLALRVSRDGWEKSLKVTLAAKQGAAPAERPQPAKPAPAPNKERGFLGIYLRQGEGGDPIVDGVMEGSPAAKAGLQVGDLVHSVNGDKVSDPSALIARIGRHGPGETITLGIRRGERDQSVQVTLGRREPQRAAPPPEARPAQPQPTPTPSDRRAPHIGVALADAGGEGPLKVDDVQAGSPAERFGLRKGDTLLAVDGQEVKTIEDFVKALEGKYAGDTLLLRIERDGWRSDVRLTLGARE